MHNLLAERFYHPVMINNTPGRDEPVKMSLLRGIKATPSYLHDGACSP